MGCSVESPDIIIRYILQILSPGPAALLKNAAWEHMVVFVSSSLPWFSLSWLLCFLLILIGVSLVSQAFWKSSVALHCCHCRCFSCFTGFSWPHPPMVKLHSVVSNSSSESSCCLPGVLTGSCSGPGLCL